MNKINYVITTIGFNVSRPHHIMVAKCSLRLVDWIGGLDLKLCQHSEVYLWLRMGLAMQ